MNTGDSAASSGERAWIGLGSNAGDREEHLRGAIERLGRAPGVEVVRVSAFRETAPVGGPVDQPAYLNAAAEVRTTLAPLALLEVLQGIERELGRRRRERWGVRPIDLDLLLYGRRVVANGRLRVPHPRLRERRFVLEPLAEIAPQATDPVTGRTAAELLRELNG
jgi:2-amino-4-hydroxy-6-hydroxymethyldihydropteridine diphosphokinase